MNEQEQILEQFKKVYGKMTLDKASKITGIQKTRFFRLINGSEMRVSEYLRIKSLIEEKVGGTSDLSKITQECIDSLNKEMIDELAEYCERKLYFSRLKKLSQNKQSIEVRRVL